MCSLCEGNYEDAIHVLFDCPKARNVWRVSQLQNDVTAAMRNNNTSRNCLPFDSKSATTKVEKFCNYCLEYLEDVEYANLAKCVENMSSYCGTCA